MKVEYTIHVRDRIIERKISETWIHETIAFPDIKSRRGNKFYVRKKINGVTLEVVYVKENYIKIITVYIVRR